MISFIELILHIGLLFSFKDYAFGNIRLSTEPKTRIVCNDDGCTRKEYPWYERNTKKYPDDFMILNAIYHKRLNSPLYEYSPGAKINGFQANNDVLINGNEPRAVAQEPSIEYFQGLREPWQEDDILRDENNDVNLDKNEFEISNEDASNSLSKRTFRNQNYYDTFMALAGLGRNFSIENLKHTRGEFLPSNGKFTNVEKANCPCIEVMGTLKLGINYYPPAILDYKCLNESCSATTHSSCKGKPYKVWVLKKRTDGDPVGSRNVDLLPEPFRKDYLFVEQWVTAGCGCSV